MKTPRVQSLLAALALLTCSSWSAGKTKSPALALPSWQAAEEPATNWMTVSYTDPATNKGSLVYCRRSDCRSSKKTGMAPLYRITQVKRETFWVDVKVPRNAIVFGRTINLGTKTERQRADKVFYSSELSNYQYDLATNEISQGSFRQKSDIFDALAKRDERSWRVPSTTLMIVSAPQNIANDIVASKPRTKPGGKNPRVKPGTDKPTTEKKPDAAVTPAPEKKPEAAGEQTTTDADADKELTEDELRELDKTGMRQEYLNKLQKAKENIKADPVMVKQVIAEYRAVAEANKKGPAADQAKLLEDYLKTKLSDADRAAFEKSLAAAKTPADRDFVLSAYLAKAAPKVEKGELAKLGKTTRKSVCGQLGHEVGAGLSPEFKAKQTLDLLEALNLEKTGFDTNKPADNSNTVKSANPTLATRSDDLKRLNTECLNLDENDKRAGAGAGSLKANVPAVFDCEKKDKDGKCVEEKKADPNEWLSVKTGAVGMLPGVMVGSFFGPVGIVVGAVIGFALFWGLSKLS